MGKASITLTVVECSCYFHLDGFSKINENRCAGIVCSYLHCKLGYNYRYKMFKNTLIRRNRTINKTSAAV